MVEAEGNMIKQVGWYNHVGQLTIGLDEKETKSDYYRHYWVPVYAIGCDLCKKHPCTCPKRK